MLERINKYPLKVQKKPIKVQVNPILVLNLEEFNQLVDYVRNGVRTAMDEHTPVTGVGIFLTQHRTKEVVFDFKINEDEFIGRDGAGGIPLFPIKADHKP